MKALELRLWRREQELEFRRLRLVRTLEDMSEEEIQALEKRYGCSVKCPEKEVEDAKDN